MNDTPLAKACLCRFDMQRPAPFCVFGGQRVLEARYHIVQVVPVQSYSERRNVVVCGFIDFSLHLSERKSDIFSTVASFLS